MPDSESLAELRRQPVTQTSRQEQIAQLLGIVLSLFALVLTGLFITSGS